MPPLNPLKLMRMNTIIIADNARNAGIRPTARAAGLTPMAVSRFCQNARAGLIRSIRQDHLYQIAAATGYTLQLSPLPRTRPTV